MSQTKPIGIGCIGCGNMGGAIMFGLAEKPEYLLSGFNRSRERMRPLMAKGVKSMADMASLVRGNRVIIVAVKPAVMDSVLRQAAPYLTKDKILISVAAGISLDAVRDAVDGMCPVVRVMPNTTALVGAGVYAMCLEDPMLTEDDKKLVTSIFAAIGTPLEIPEQKFGAFTAVVGSGPAYVFKIMDAIVQSAVTLGFTRKEAKAMVDSLFAGSARMAAISEHSLSDLVDQVCSPGGITIAAVNYMDRHALRGIIVDAIMTAEARDRELSR